MIDTPTIFDNLRALFEDAITLFRKEVELARAEFDEKLAQAQHGLILIFAGLTACAVAVFLLAQALVSWLAIYLGPAGAALAIGGAILVIGIICLSIGFSNLKARNLKPVRTIRSATESAQRLKETINDQAKR